MSTRKNYNPSPLKDINVEHTNSEVQSVHDVRDATIVKTNEPQLIQSQQRVILNITKKQYAQLNQLDDDEIILFQQCFNAIVSLATKGNSQ